MVLVKNITFHIRHTSILNVMLIHKIVTCMYCMCTL